jgi:hypothetical protein
MILITYLQTYSLRVKHTAHNGQNKGSSPFKSKIKKEE